ncbi:MAG: tRNA uridine-5-carboxymethylaminomethyl(34) synthesis GTPase MnmE [Hyphomicrobiaceae bacterium]|nr:tRNA uridine-5-carboxymethylaminomethyl(34) synthesis GTPase MnmE [Hyphomicrobiaceae bacterium]MCC0024281.1 tRNA uridine-5-carboxymethylaminomethyl(34) synthesis GTPase MnmE [Hyphomicrobiaceae bacterium]
MSGGAETIVALSSGVLPSGVAIVRVSGPKAGFALKQLCGSVPEPRRATLRAVRAAGGELIDQALVLFFPAPQSFTGEDVAELQVHGSRAVVSALLAELLSLDDVGMAEPGDFARRAFENGKLDLADVDALRDLVDAETESQRKLALARQAGNLRHKVEAWRKALVSLLVQIEAELDFSDEDDVGTLDASGISAALHQLRNEWEVHLRDYARGQLIRDGFRVVLIGAPNSGKSSLLNALANSDIAIVTDEAGTTRDLKDVAVNIAGQLFIIVDSAGLRHAESKAEQEGVRRALEAIESADLCLLLRAPDVDTEYDVDIPKHAPILRVASKSDLGVVTGCDLVLSALTGEGIAHLLEILKERADSRLEGGEILASQLRDRTALERALAVTRDLELHIDELELCAEGIRRAIFELDRLIGRVDVEDMLDELFSGFCIGK